MKKLRIAALLGMAVIAAAGYALAQGIIPLASPTGTELIYVLPIQSNGQPAATQAQITLNQMRNTTGYLTVPTGGTVTCTPTNAVNNLIAIGAIRTWNITLPNPAFDGELFSIENSTAAAFTTNTGVTAASTPQAQVLAVAFTGQTLAANGGGAEWQFQLSNLT